ncbi:hypothetical protein [Larkinella rosea]|uniref:hypothetical protein n=1 Tax=Larkinella rosea TaxID=2025312 RepID=UPI00163971FD|nr:hypothetical protein [Larkinella rosea]
MSDKALIRSNPIISHCHAPGCEGRFGEAASVRPSDAPGLHDNGVSNYPSLFTLLT